MFGDEVVARAQILHFAAQRPECGLDLRVLRGSALPVWRGGAGEGEVVTRVVYGRSEETRKKNMLRTLYRCYGLSYFLLVGYSQPKSRLYLMLKCWPESF